MRKAVPEAKETAAVDYPALRRSKLVDTLAGEGLDAILVGGTANVSYLTSFSGDSSYLVLGREGALLVSDGRFTQQIAEECPGLPAHIRPTGQTLYQAPASARQVQEGELVLVDWGASGRFYKSDLTRVLVPRTNSPFQSRANALRARGQLEQVYAAVLQAQEQALRIIRPGVPAQEVD